MYTLSVLSFINNFNKNNIMFYMKIKDDEGKTIAFKTEIPVFSKDFFANEMVPQLIFSRTGNIVDKSNINIEYACGEENFDLMVDLITNNKIIKNIYFKKFIFNIIEENYNSFAPNCECIAIFEDYRKIEKSIIVDNLYVSKEKADNIDYKIDIEKFISIFDKYGNLVIDDNVLKYIKN